MIASANSKQELLRLVQEQQKVKDELQARIAERDPYFWLTQCTKTKDEQHPELPDRPFPDKAYIYFLLQWLSADDWSVGFLKKARTMMASWTVSGWCAHQMFTQRNVGVVFQSEDEDRALHDVEYVKVLWDNSLPALRDRWKLALPFGQEGKNYFELANGSWCRAITGNPDKIRSQHPTYVVLDEAAHIVEFEASYNIAVRTLCKKIISLSSAAPGSFELMCETAKPVDWPYPLPEAA